MSTSMGRRLGALVVMLHAVAACDSDGEGPPAGPGSGGTDPTGQGGSGGTDPNGQGGNGGTDPNGQGGNGGTDPNGQGGSGGTDPEGQGGTGGTEPQGQGGMAGAAGGAGAAGDQGFAGAAGDHNGPCESDCEPCEHDYVFTECEDNRCVCEFPNNPYKQDQAELLACDLDEPCPPSTLYRDSGTARWEGGACLLTKLRDRTPGKYQFSSTFADAGSQTTDYTFLLNGSDEILMLAVDTGGLVAGNLTRNHWWVLSCTLKSHDELDACVTAGTNVSPDRMDAACENTEDWFQDCEQVENPECPVE